MRAIKLLSAVVAAFLLVLSASTAGTAAPGKPGGDLSTAACGATHSEWVGTFQGSVAASQGGSVTVRAVFRQGGGDLLVDTYADGRLEGTAAVPWYEGLQIRWNTSTGIGPMFYSFGPTTCSGGHITTASAFRQWYWPCCYNWNGTVNRQS
jgi:hypothetical protein